MPAILKDLKMRHYNTRPRGAEVMLEGNDNGVAWRIIRERERLEHLVES